MVKGSKSTRRKYRSGVSIKLPKIRHTLGTGDQFDDLISLTTSIKQFADYLLYKNKREYRTIYDMLSRFGLGLRLEIIDELNKIKAEIQSHKNALPSPAGGAGMDVEKNAKNAMNDMLSKFTKLGI